MVVATFVLAVLMTVGFLLLALQTAHSEDENTALEAVHEKTATPDQGEETGTP